MQSRHLSGLRTAAFITALAFIAGGCATPVAVSPQGPSQNTIVTSYNWGTMSHDIGNDVPSTFKATNDALDNLHYFRVGQENVPATGAPTKSTVYARGVQDVLVTVTIKPSKTAGQTELSVELDPEDLPKTQAIYSEILKNLGSSFRPAPVNQPSGLSSPTRPQGS